MYSISILGPLEVVRDGQRISVPAGKTSELLIRLALDAGVVVSTERLIDDLWGAGASATARNTLQAKVSLLRRALSNPGVVTGGRGGYTLRVDRSAVDALQILVLADEVTARVTAGDAPSAVTVSTRALALFRGDILSAGADGEWLIPQRVRLEEVRQNLIEDRLAARMELGAGAELIGELEGLVVLHPLRERLWTLLITALYRDGRQADALAAFRRIRDHLGNELGIDPGPDLQRLEQRVLLGDRGLLAAQPASDQHPPQASTAAEPAVMTAGNLPTLSAQLFGRQIELIELGELLREHRLVTLVGPSGVGKTRLAIEVARGRLLPGGRWFVRLENARIPAALPLSLGEALGISGPTEALVIDRLRGVDALLVLDNCEHVLDSVTALIDRLLTALPDLTVLATSQVPLDLDGERVYQLEPLGMADSVELFASIAAQRRRSFVLDREAETAIEDVCRSLDGLPLAIELAAARTKALSVQEIARRLDNRFSLLSDPGGRRPERHRTLGTAIAWSYDLLFPDDKRGLWALACFSGGAPLDAAETVAGTLGVPGEAAVDVIGRLVDRSLVTADVAAGGAVRYRLLDSVRAFVLARLAEAGLSAAAGAAHAAWFADAADCARADQHGPAQVRHISLVRVERANIDAALGWAAGHDPVLGMRIANGFGWSSVILGEGAVAAQRIRAALGAANGLVSAADQALALSLVGWNEAGADVQRARVEAQESVRIADTTGDRTLIAASRFALAFALIQSGEPRAAMDLLDQWRSTAGDLVPGWDVELACVLVGYAGLAAGEATRARAACEEAGPLLDIVGDDWLTSHIESILGQVAQAEHNFPLAAEHLVRAAAAARRIELPATEGFHLAALGRVQQQAGDQQAAISTLEHAIELTRTVGLMRVVALAQVRLGRLLRSAGETASARAALQAADTWFRASGGGEEALLAESLLAALDAENTVPNAAERLTALLERASAVNDPEVLVLTLDALAALRASAGDVDETAILLARADELMPAARHRILDTDRLDAQRARSLLHAASAANAAY